MHALGKAGKLCEFPEHKQTVSPTDVGETTRDSPHVIFLKLLLYSTEWSFLKGA